MVPTTAQIAQLKESIKQHRTQEQFANAVRINKGIVSRAVRGIYVAPILAKEMGWHIPVSTMPCPTCGDRVHDFNCASHTVKRKPRPAPTRTRIAADVTVEQREALRDFAALMGMSWSEYCRWFAGGLIDMNKEK